MYTVYQWMAFFYIYCFCGWIWETTYVSICQRKFVNRGFLHGPWIPLYGSGALVMLFLALPVRDNLILTYIAGFIGPTILELVTGWAMEKIFKVRYWDYSKQKFQFHGYICLKSSLFWGVMTVVMVRWIHDPIERIVLRQPDWAVILAVSILTVLFVIDFALSTKEALNLRKILVSLEKLRSDMERVQAELNQRLEESREQLNKTIEENRKQMEERLEENREKIEANREENKARREENRKIVEERIEEGREQREARREETKARHEENRELVEEKLAEGREQREARREQSRELISAQVEESRERRAERREQRLADLENAHMRTKRLLDENRKSMSDLLDETHGKLTERVGSGRFQISGMMEDTRAKINAMMDETKTKMNVINRLPHDKIEQDVDELEMMASMEADQKILSDLYDRAREQIADNMEQGVQAAETLQKELTELQSQNEVELGELRLAHRKLRRRHPSARAGRWEEVLEEKSSRENDGEDTTA